jgi:DNA-directed RNA polymerase specialized sigma24 family protein
LLEKRSEVVVAERGVQISKQAFDWLKVGDRRAYDEVGAYLRHVARKLGVRDADAEDLVQSTLEGLLRAQERGSLPVRDLDGVHAYLFVCVRNCRTNELRKQRAQRVDPLPEPAAPAGDGPDAALRELEHVQLCLGLMRRALELAGASAAHRPVLDRLLERFVLGRDMETTLIRSGLLSADASARERSTQRDTENRRQSRLRVKLNRGFVLLKEAALAADGTSAFDSGGSRVSFDVEDVESALRFARSLGRCEGTEAELGKRQT